MTAHAFTANMESIRALCDKALDAPNGLEIAFTVERYGSLKACATRARSVQTTFTSLRSRARALTNRLRSEAYHNIKGPYDGLACFREPLDHDRGWRVKFVHATDLLKDIIISDPVTGEPLETEEQRERAFLSHKLFNDFARFTPHDFDRLAEFDPLLFPQLGLARSQCDGYGTAFGRAEENKRNPTRLPVDLTAHNVDLLDALTPGDLFGEGEEGG